jgi:hypothetical protein
MQKIKTLEWLEELSGESFKSGWSGESLYYRARWDEICGKAGREARRQRLCPPRDVRAASYALDILGIPYQYTEADQDDRGRWFIYWR